MKVPIVTLLLLLLFVTGNVIAAERNCAEIDQKGNCTLFFASLIELIANPTKFDGKRVRIIGFLRLEFEGNAIYLSKSDFEHGVTKNGLWVSIEASNKELRSVCFIGRNFPCQGPWPYGFVERDY
jgi:hypothetical protein